MSLPVVVVLEAVVAAGVGVVLVAVIALLIGFDDGIAAVGATDRGGERWLGGRRRGLRGRESCVGISVALRGWGGRDGRCIGGKISAMLNLGGRDEVMRAPDGVRIANMNYWVRARGAEAVEVVLSSYRWWWPPRRCRSRFLGIGANTPRARAGRTCADGYIQANAVVVVVASLVSVAHSRDWGEHPRASAGKTSARMWRLRMFMILTWRRLRGGGRRRLGLASAVGSGLEGAEAVEVVLRVALDLIKGVGARVLRPGGTGAVDGADIGGVAVGDSPAGAVAA